MADYLAAGAIGLKINAPIVHARGVGRKYEYRNGLGIGNSAEFNVFFDDFNELVTTNVPTGWAAAIIDTGATVVTSTVAGHSSVLLFDSDGAAEGTSIYLPAGIQLTAGKKFFLEARFQTEVADDTDVQIGLAALTATTNPEDLWTTTATDVIAFGVLDGGSGITGMLSDASNGGTTVQVGTISLVNATWHVLAIAYDGVNLSGWVDGQRSLTWSGASTTVPTGVALAPFVGFRNGSTAANEGQCDYFRYAQER